MADPGGWLQGTNKKAHKSRFQINITLSSLNSHLQGEKMEGSKRKEQPSCRLLTIQVFKSAATAVSSRKVAGFQK